MKAGWWLGMKAGGGSARWAFLECSAGGACTGQTESVADRHSRQVSDADFERAVRGEGGHQRADKGADICADQACAAISVSRCSATKMRVAPRLAQPAFWAARDSNPGPPQCECGALTN